jgi:DNA-binding transcriptional LysR family regulator
MEDAISDTHMVKLACVFSGATAIALVAEGIGVMAIPTALATAELEAGTLRTIPVRQTPPNLYMSACFKKEHQSIFLSNIVAIAGECAKNYAESVSNGLVWV